MQEPTYEERAAHAARSQSLFRDVNERVREINAAFNVVLPLGDWICECAVQECSERISMTSEEYEAVRAHSARFIVAPRDEHLVPEVEVVVERTDRYWVLEKVGEAGELAAKVDPRRVASRGATDGAAAL